MADKPDEIRFTETRRKAPEFIHGDCHNTFKIAERMLNNPTLLTDVAFVRSMKEAERFIRSRLYQPYGVMR